MSLIFSSSVSLSLIFGAFFCLLRRGLMSRGLLLFFLFLKRILLFFSPFQMWGDSAFQGVTLKSRLSSCRFKLSKSLRGNMLIFLSLPECAFDNPPRIPRTLQSPRTSRRSTANRRKHAQRHTRHHTSCTWPAIPSCRVSSYPQSGSVGPLRPSASLPPLR